MSALMPSDWRLPDWLLPWLFIAVAALCTYLWRALGVLLSGRIDVESPGMRWVAAVAYAMLAGLIARLIVLPAGVLASVPLGDRLLAVAATLAVYFLTRRNIAIGVMAGALTLIVLLWHQGTGSIG